MMCTINRKEAIEKIVVYKRSHLTQCEIESYALDYHIDESDLRIFEEKLIEALSEGFIGVSNDFLEDQLQLLYDEKYHVHGEVEVLFPCPVCFYRTLKDKGEYYICELCKWEDDGTDTDEVYSVSNQSNIRDYRDKHLTLKSSNKYLK